jgi:hypothetical protein
MSFTMGFCYVHHLSPTELLDYSFNPYPGGFMANMTFKTHNSCDKFIIHPKKFKQISNPQFYLGKFLPK